MSTLIYQIYFSFFSSYFIGKCLWIWHFYKYMYMKSLLIWYMYMLTFLCCYDNFLAVNWTVRPTWPETLSPRQVYIILYFNLFHFLCLISFIFYHLLQSDHEHFFKYKKSTLRNSQTQHNLIWTALIIWRQPPLSHHKTFRHSMKLH